MVFSLTADDFFGERDGKTPICNSQIFSWKVTGYTEYFRVKGNTMNFKVLGFTGVYRGITGGNKTEILFLIKI